MTHWSSEMGEGGHTFGRRDKRTGRQHRAVKGDGRGTAKAGVAKHSRFRRVSASMRTPTTLTRELQHASVVWCPGAPPPLQSFFGRQRFGAKSYLASQERILTAGEYQLAYIGAGPHGPGEPGQRATLVGGAELSDSCFLRESLASALRHFHRVPEILSPAPYPGRIPHRLLAAHTSRLGIPVRGGPEDSVCVTT